MLPVVQRQSVSVASLPGDRSRQLYTSDCQQNPQCTSAWPHPLALAQSIPLLQYPSFCPQIKTPAKTGSHSQTGKRK